MAILMLFLPILVGALIGYVTNAIAIKMLFRPYYEKRVFNIRIPFTPGVIPRQRKKLASGIADLVSKELITEDALYAHIKEDAFYYGLQSKISEVIQDILDGNQSLNLEKDVINKIDELLKILIVAFLSSSYIIKPINTILHFLVDQLKELRLNDILKSQSSLSLDKLEKLVLDNLRSDKNKTVQNLRNFFVVIIEKAVLKEVYLKEFISDQILLNLEDFLKKIYPTFSYILEDILEKKATKKIISEQIVSLINENKNILGMFEGFIIGFFNTKDNMDSIVEKMSISIKKTINKKETQDNIIKSIMDYIKKLSNRKISDLQNEYKINISNVIDSISYMTSKYIKSEDFEKNLKFYLISIKRNYKNLSIMEIISNILNIEQKDFSESIQKIIEDYLQKSENIDYISNILKTFIIKFFEEDNRIVLNISEEKKERVDLLVCQMAYKFLLSQIPNIVKSLKVYDIVFKKIEGLDVKDVERLVLEIMQNQFGWINIFGGILGALMGCLQILISVFKN